LLHLRENPRVGGGRAADHYGVAAGLLDHALGIFGHVDVAITDYGNAYGLLDGGDDVPVGLAGVALHACARVDGDAFDADGFGEPGDVDRDDGIFVPAGAELDGQRNLYGGAHGAEDLLQQRQVAQQAGAAALDYFFGRAAEIDVDRVVTKMRSDFYANLENPIDRASVLSHAVLFDGSFDRVYQIPDELAKVTPAQIRAFAAKYLVANNRTIINRVPAPKESDTAKQPGGAQ